MMKAKGKRMVAAKRKNTLIEAIKSPATAHKQIAGKRVAPDFTALDRGAAQRKSLNYLVAASSALASQSSVLSLAAAAFAARGSRMR